MGRCATRRRGATGASCVTVTVASRRARTRTWFGFRLRSRSPVPRAVSTPPSTAALLQAGVAHPPAAPLLPMKAFLNRLNRGLTGSKEKERDNDAPTPKEKIPQLPPLPDWPPQRVTSTPNSVNSFKPLPEINTRPLPPIEEPSSSSTDSSVTTTPIAVNQPLPGADTKENVPAVKPASSTPQPSRSEPDSAGRSSRKNANGTSHSTDAQKKVAFISPPPTPGPAQDRGLPAAGTPTPPSTGVKSTVSRFHAAQGKETRGSTSTAASSRTDVSSTLKSNKAASTRTATSPYPGKNYGETASLHQSLRSGTPYSSMSNTGSRILAAQSWSEGAEEDLVSNLGQRERTRQEVLWEIVASEERFVIHCRAYSVAVVLSTPQICERASKDEGDLHRAATTSLCGHLPSLLANTRL